MRRKILFGLLVLTLEMVAVASDWQVYVPFREDAENVRACK